MALRLGLVRTLFLAMNAELCAQRIFSAINLRFIMIFYHQIYRKLLGERHIISENTNRTSEN